MSINRAIQGLVRERTRFLCEYCHSSKEAGAAQFEIDHILPKSLGGADDPDNLALACQRCNAYHYNFTTAVDPQTQETLPLFNPRKLQWADHFIWTAGGLRLIGITPVGRATCARLDFNDDQQ